MKTHFFCLLIILATVIASCKKDPGTEPDLTLPTLTVSGLIANDTLRNTITAQIKAEDAGQIAKLEAFANDSLISSATSGNLQLTWNTLKSKDGDYTLKIVATDASGNKKESITQVVVSNCLISIENGFVIDQFREKTTFLVTDSAGKVLSTLKLSRNSPLPAGRTYIYPKEAFTGKKVNVIRVTQDPQKTVRFFADVRRGEYFQGYRHYTVKNKIKVGNTQTTVSFKNTTQVDELSISNSYSQGYAGLFPGNENFKMFYSAEKSLLLQIEKNSVGKHHFFNIPNGTTSFEVDVNLAVSNSLKRTIKLPAGINGGSIQAHLRVEKGFDDTYMVCNKSFTGSLASVFYPDGFSGELQGTIGYFNGGYYYDYYYLDNLPETITQPNFTAQVQTSDLRNFSATFGGDFQHYVAEAYHGDISVEIIGSRDQSKFKFPDLSAAELELPGFDPAKMKVSSLSMVKYSYPVDYKFNLTTVFLPLSSIYKTDNNTQRFIVRKLL